MIEGVRSRGALAAFGLSRRLVTRLGSLLSRGLACSEALLESARPDSAVERFILGPEISAEADRLTAERLNEIAAAAGVGERLALVETPDGRVAALAEELEADRAWKESEGDSSSALAKLANTPTLAAAPASGSGQARDALFDAAEVERLKLTALTSASAEEAVGALRRLAFAPVPPAERGEVFVRALASAEARVQAEAARLLAGVGLPAETSEALVGLATGSEKEQEAAVDRIGHALSGRGSQSADLAMVSALVGLTAALGAGHPPRVCGRVLSALASAAPTLARFPERMAELVRRVLLRLLSGSAEAEAGTREFLENLRRAAPGQLAGLLRAELEGTSQAQLRALLVAQLAALARETPEHLPVSDACRLLVSEMGSGLHQESDRQLLGIELMNMPPDAAVSAMLDGFTAASVAAQRQFLRLTADTCRFRKVSDDAVRAAGRTFLECLESGNKDLRLGVLETVLPCDVRLDEALRGRLAAACLDSFDDLVFRSDIELVESTLSRMGRAALPALIERLTPAWRAPDRIRACRVIGEMARLSGPGQAPATEENRIALQDCLRRLLVVSADDFPSREELALAIGKLAGAVGDPSDALAAARSRIGGMTLPEAARLEALSWAAASPSADADMVRDGADGLLRLLAEPEPDSLGRVAEVRAGGERSLELLPEAADFAARLPGIIRSLVRFALAPAADATLRSRVLAAMVNRWKDLVSGRSIWGPAAATVLIEGLRDLACRPSARPAERLEVIRALGVRLGDPPVMRAVAAILAADRASPELAGPAAAAALAILGRRDRSGRIPEEEREHVLWALARILNRSAIETGDPRAARLRERIVDELRDGLRDGVPGTAGLMEELAGSDSLPAELRKTIESALAARRALAARPPATS